nr:hypothetical protein [uncultured Chryseobacterium sp.]
MKRGIKLVISTVAICIFFYYALGYFSSFVGWYGYQKWKYRRRTDSIETSKERKIFVKELQYKIVDSTNLKGFYFKPYIEKGFRYGYHSMEETKIDRFTQYPYNLSYERNKRDLITLDIYEEDKEKLDSSDIVWGYLKTPYLRDTIRIKIEGPGRQKGTIKIW